MPVVPRSLMSWVLVAFFVVAGVPAAAQEVVSIPWPATKANVRFAVRLGFLQDGKPVPTRSYELVLADGGTSTKLITGAKVPIPVARSKDDDDKTSFIYQNIGFISEVQAWILDDRRIRVYAKMEDSSIEESSDPDRPPTVGTRELMFHLVLEDGVPVEVTRVDGMRQDLAGYVEVEAKILE